MPGIGEPESARKGGYVFAGRVAIGYDHGYDAQKFYLGLALDPGYVEGYLERIGEDDPDGEYFLQGLCWAADRVFVLFRPLIRPLGGLPVLP